MSDFGHWCQCMECGVEGRHPDAGGTSFEIDPMSHLPALDDDQVRCVSCGSHDVIVTELSEEDGHL